MMRKILALVALTAACVETADKAPPDSTTVARTTPVITSVRVNNGTYGMRSQVKWILSSDSSGILAMVDPVGVENEPIPNSFFYGSEARNFQARMDSVWDVAVSPDWSTIAFSRAFIVNPREADSIPPAMWQEVARRTGLDTTTVRTSSFPSSGMSMARAIAQPGTITIPRDAHASGASDDAAPKVYPIAIGWRVRWTTDGSFIALGNSPASVSDAEGSETWASLDPKTGVFHTTLPVEAKTIAPGWINGPVLELSAPVDMQGAPQLNISASGRRIAIESTRGVITAREVGVVPDSAARSYTIGSGKALVATKGGRYILALAPRAKAVAGEMPVEVVVYIVGW
jgi:hypothetical protein